MGAIIFGFMWLQQPSQEELAARREQAEAQRIEAERQAKADEEMRMLGNVDTVSAGEVNMLRAAVIEYGAVDANGVKTLAADGVKVVLEGDDLNGTIEINGTSVSVAEALNNTSSNPVTHNRALAKLRTEVNKYVKNGVFAK